MTKCTNGVRAATGLPYGCLTMFNTSTDTVTLLEPYIGDATGIAAVTGLHKIYTAQGGQVYITPPWTARRSTTSTSRSPAQPTTWPTWTRSPTPTTPFTDPMTPCRLRCRSAAADVLAIAAHRDDVEQTCGGTLLRMASRGLRTAILDLTQGEAGTRGSAEERAARGRRSRAAAGRGLAAGARPARRRN